MSSFFGLNLSVNRYSFSLLTEQIEQRLRRNDMAKKLYVGNLSFSVTDDELQQAFASFGTISSARVVMDRMTGRSKGFGFVELEDDGAADDAISKMDGQTIGGRPVRVSEAKPQEDRPRGGSGGGGGRGERY